MIPRPLLPLVMLLALLPAALRAEVTEVAHYDLAGIAGIRDVAAPAVWKNSAGNGPDLARLGTPHVMSQAPAERRMRYDSSVDFSAPDQCYRFARALVRGDDVVLETWVRARVADDPGFHAVVANGNGGSGFLLCQEGDHWSVLVGGVGATALGAVQADVWTHLAVVVSGGQARGYVAGEAVARLPTPGEPAANFAIGATAPGVEAFRGCIAEVRVATFAPGAFVPASDFLLDNARLAQAQAGQRTQRAALISSLLAAQPGVVAVDVLREPATSDDWLIHPPTTPVTVQVAAAADRQAARLMLCNGVASRTFLVSDNLACIGLRRSDKDLEFVRAVKPEVRLRVDGGGWIEVGGLGGAPEASYLVDAWLQTMSTSAAAFRFTGFTTGAPQARYPWQAKCNAPALPWPPPGLRLTLHFAAPPTANATLKGLGIDVVYEMYEGMPVVMKWFQVRNRTAAPLIIDEFDGELLAVLQDKVPLLHVESDYSCAFINAFAEDSSLGLHGGDHPRYDQGGTTTRWEVDPEYNSWATHNQAEDGWLKSPHRCLLRSRCPLGPAASVAPAAEFASFRTFEILGDSTERERSSLAQRHFYRRLAPQTNEHLLECHAATHDVRVLDGLLDQMGELGFERLQIEYPDGIAYDDLSDGNVHFLKAVCDHARERHVLVGAYELMIASRDRGAAVDVIDPATGKPGSPFGQSVCVASAWSDAYFPKLWSLVERTGLGSVNPDGPYHGDVCASTSHAHHRGLADSQWEQWKIMCDYFHEGQRRNLFMTAPDWYFLNGQCCTGMGYREATDGIDIVLQTMIYRQYIFDGTWFKNPGMGWVNLNTDVLRGGLEQNLDKYERQLFQMLGSGAEVWVRCTRLYDTARTQAMLVKWLGWFKRYRAILTSDIIHMHRPDGRSPDSILHVNPQLKEKGMLLVFNPTAEAVTREFAVPLYYTGLTEIAHVREQEGSAKEYRLDREGTIHVPITIAANGYTWLVIE